MGMPEHCTWPLRNLYAGQEATEQDMEKWTGSKLGKEHVKAVYCHPAYSTNMQTTSCKMLGCTSHKMAGRNINNLRCSDGRYLNGRKWRGTKETFDEGKRGEWKSWLKTQHSKKQRLWHQIPSLHSKKMGQKWIQWQILFSYLQNYCAQWWQPWN